MLTAHGRQSLQFIQRIKCTVFRRMRYIHHSRSHHVIPARVLVESRHITVYFFRIQLSFMVRQSQHLMSSCFHRSGLMLVDVARFCCNHSFIRTKQGRNDRGIGLRTSHHEMYFRLRTPASFCNFPASRCTILIRAIARSFLHIRLTQALQNQRMRSFHVITFKILHIRFVF